MKFSCILNWIKKNRVYVNSGCVIAVVNIYKSSLTMEETILNKGILEKLTREGKSLAFYTIVNKAETLKHLIVYNNLWTYINPTSVH